MKTATKLVLAFIITTQFGGCSVRMFIVGDEHSVTDRVDSIGHYNEKEIK